MLLREDGSVVNNKLKVSLRYQAPFSIQTGWFGPQEYGTMNIRVTDISIIPLHIAAHPQGELYSFHHF